MHQFNCVNFLDKPKILFNDINLKIDAHKKQKCIFFLIGVESLFYSSSTPNRDLFRAIVNKIIKKVSLIIYLYFRIIYFKKKIKLFTASKESWIVIQSKYLRTMLSNPIQFNIPDNQNGFF